VNPTSKYQEGDPLVKFHISENYIDFCNISFGQIFFMFKYHRINVIVCFKLKYYDNVPNTDAETLKDRVLCRLHSKDKKLEKEQAWNNNVPVHPLIWKLLI